MRCSTEMCFRKCGFTIDRSASAEGRIALHNTRTGPGIAGVMAYRRNNRTGEVRAIRPSADAERSIVNPHFRKHISVEQRIASLTRQFSGRAGGSRTDHYRRLASGLIPFGLEIADKASAAFCVDARYPFYDKRLAEFCLALPAEQKLFNGWTR